jgi:hypothetical protein
MLLQPFAHEQCEFGFVGIGHGVLSFA